LPLATYPLCFEHIIAFFCHNKMNMRWHQIGPLGFKSESTLRICKQVSAEAILVCCVTGS
jgi:hypothetical protein